MVGSALELSTVGLASAALGGPGWSFLSSWFGLKASNRKDEFARLDRRCEDLVEELASCHEKHGTLETRLRAVEQRSGSYFALWIKDRRKRLVWLNDKAFLTLFAPLGFTRDELDGKTFQDLFDGAAAAEIDRLDVAALAQPGHTQSALVQLHSDLPYRVVIKVASIAENGDVQYEGLAYDPGDPEIRHASGVTRQRQARQDAKDHRDADAG
jgi:hypothetical protein